MFLQILQVGLDKQVLDNGNDNTSATPEVLVAIGPIYKFRCATIDAVNFQVGQTVSGLGGSVIKVEVHYNEQVTVDFYSL